jgi:hypothetical protein
VPIRRICYENPLPFVLRYFGGHMQVARIRIRGEGKANLVHSTNEERSKSPHDNQTPRLKEDLGRELTNQRNRLVEWVSSVLTFGLWTLVYTNAYARAGDVQYHT